MEIDVEKKIFIVYLKNRAKKKKSSWYRNLYVVRNIFQLQIFQFYKMRKIVLWQMWDIHLLVYIWCIYWCFKYLPYKYQTIETKYKLFCLFCTLYFDNNGFYNCILVNSIMFNIFLVNKKKISIICSFICRTLLCITISAGLFGFESIRLIAVQ